MWIVVTMDDGTAFTSSARAGCCRRLIPNFSSTWIEISWVPKSAVMVDDTHRDVYTSTLQRRVFNSHFIDARRIRDRRSYAGPMERETLHFLECIALGKQPLVTGDQARLAMQVYQAADVSVETNQPVELVHDRVAQLVS